MYPHLLFRGWGRGDALYIGSVTSEGDSKNSVARQNNAGMKILVSIIGQLHKGRGRFK
jgi:hypothetical protein